MNPFVKPSSSIGEFLSDTETSVSMTTGNYSTIGSIDFSGKLPGWFLVSAGFTTTNTITTATDSRGLALLTFPGDTNVTGDILGFNYMLFETQQGSAASNRNNVSVTFVPIFAYWDGTNSITLNGNTNVVVPGTSLAIQAYPGTFTGGNLSISGTISALRIA